jgi:hypothetical protein
MVAVAFEADIVSEFLRIPNFEQFKNKHVRVVIEAEDADKKATETSEIDQLFNAFQIDTANYHFDRNEANER